MDETKGIVFNIERYTLHDGPGIRTTVFLKGCPLRCLWCCNPESQNLKKEMTFFPTKCTGCGHCRELCPNHAIVQEERQKPIKIIFDKCVGCGTCVEKCHAEALVPVGQEMTANEVVSYIKKDLPFYKRSNGGVTLSGGEPLLQIEFAKDILEGCKNYGIHTAIQTCGFVPEKNFDLILPYLDLIIFDIKHLDPQEHLKLTGVENARIMENIQYLNSRHANLVLQIPLIPGLNDSAEHLADIFHFAKKLDAVKGISILAYHRLGVLKYDRLGRPYSLADLQAPSAAYLRMKKKWCRQFGVPLINFNG